MLAGCTEDESVPKQTPAAGRAEEFRAAHQTGILGGPYAFGVVAALDSTAPDRAALGTALRTLSERIEALLHGDPLAAEGPTDLTQPPADSGLLLDLEATQILRGATVSVGASLFDGRYGLAGVKPAELITMPAGLSSEQLDAARLHGDLLLVLQADQPDVAVHALRTLIRATGQWLTLRWAQETFSRPDTIAAPDRVSTRNLMGFKDGTANPDASAADLMDDLVWTASSDGTAAGAAEEPAWAAGGSYQAVRIIRMFVENWDATTLDHQQLTMGRQKVSGAPLGSKREADVPVYPADPDGKVIPRTAHIRLANPRDGEAKLMLRRGMSYSRGLDQAGQLDQGLLFVSYQSTLTAFTEAQERLRGEPLEAFIQTNGGGFFYALPGPGSSGWLGQSLIES